MVARSVSSRRGNEVVLAQIERSFGEAAARLSTLPPPADLP
jgi:hypothetical protein